jgi:hypothetical protein
MKLGMILTDDSWKEVNRLGVKDDFVKRISLASVVRTDTVTLHDVDSVADTASLAPGENLTRTGLRRIQFEATGIIYREIIEPDILGPFERRLGAG